MVQALLRQRIPAIPRSMGANRTTEQYTDMEPYAMIQVVQAMRFVMDNASIAVPLNTIKSIECRGEASKRGKSH